LHKALHRQYSSYRLPYEKYFNTKLRYILRKNAFYCYPATSKSRCKPSSLKYSVS
jgi:hypothetical protein